MAVLILIGSIIASAYVWYFVGMALSVAAGSILGVAGGVLATGFAWAGVVIAVLAFVVIVAKIVDKAMKATQIQRIELSEEEFEEIFGDKKE